MRHAINPKSESVTVGSVVSTEDPDEVRWRGKRLESVRKTVDLTCPVSAPITSSVLSYSSSIVPPLFSLRVVPINRFLRIAGVYGILKLSTYAW